jgi:hypothetical protein
VELGALCEAAGLSKVVGFEHVRPALGGTSQQLGGHHFHKVLAAQKVGKGLDDGVRDARNGLHGRGAQVQSAVVQAHLLEDVLDGLLRLQGFFLLLLYIYINTRVRTKSRFRFDWKGRNPLQMSRGAEWAGRGFLYVRRARLPLKCYFSKIAKKNSPIHRTSLRLFSDLVVFLLKQMGNSESKSPQIVLMGLFLVLFCFPKTIHFCCRSRQFGQSGDGDSSIFLSRNRNHNS